MLDLCPILHVRIKHEIRNTGSDPFLACHLVHIATDCWVSRLILGFMSTKISQLDLGGGGIKSIIHAAIGILGHAPQLGGMEPGKRETKAGIVLRLFAKWTTEDADIYIINSKRGFPACGLMDNKG